MTLTSLNPFVRSAEIYERVGATGERVGYDSRIIYMISGDISVTVGGERLGHLSPGELVFIPAGTPYALKGKYMRAAVLTFDLSDSWCELTERIPPVVPEEFTSEECHHVTLSPFDKYIRLEGLESEREEFIGLSNVFTSREGFYRETVSARLKLLLIKIAEHTDGSALPTRMVEALDSYIRENVGEEISNTEIGAVFGYHPYYASKLLKDRRGMTMRQYINAYRLKLSRKLLEVTEKSTTEIAEECGFTDASYFAKTFKAAYGVTPKEHRNKFKDSFI